MLRRAGLPRPLGDVHSDKRLPDVSGGAKRIPINRGAHSRPVQLAHGARHADQMADASGQQEDAHVAGPQLESPLLLDALPQLVRASGSARERRSEPRGER